MDICVKLIDQQPTSAFISRHFVVSCPKIKLQETLNCECGSYRYINTHEGFHMSVKIAQHRRHVRLTERNGSLGRSIYVSKGTRQGGLSSPILLNIEKNDSLRGGGGVIEQFKHCLGGGGGGGV